MTDSEKLRCFVIKSPWPNRLPNGTDITRVKKPVGEKDGIWFKRSDGELLFKDSHNPLDKLGVFRLFPGEFDMI